MTPDAQGQTACIQIWACAPWRCVDAARAWALLGTLGGARCLLVASLESGLEDSGLLPHDGVRIGESPLPRSYGICAVRCGAWFLRSGTGGSIERAGWGACRVCVMQARSVGVHYMHGSFCVRYCLRAHRGSVGTWVSLHGTVTKAPATGRGVDRTRPVLPGSRVNTLGLRLGR